MPGLATPRRLAALLLPLCVAGCQDWAGRYVPTDFAERATAVAGTPCADWRMARIDHPLDAWLGNPMPSRSARLGCANDANLRAQVARPDDLTPDPASHGHAPADGAHAGAAVERYRADKLKPLPRRNSEIGSN